MHEVNLYVLDFQEVSGVNEQYSHVASLAHNLTFCHLDFHIQVFEV